MTVISFSGGGVKESKLNLGASLKGLTSEVNLVENGVVLGSGSFLEMGRDTGLRVGLRTEL